MWPWYLKINVAGYKIFSSHLLSLIFLKYFIPLSSGIKHCCQKVWWQSDFLSLIRDTDLLISAKKNPLFSFYLKVNSFTRLCLYVAHSGSIILLDCVYMWPILGQFHQVCPFKCWASIFSGQKSRFWIIIDNICSFITLIFFFRNFYFMFFGSPIPTVYAFFIYILKSFYFKNIHSFLFYFS